MGYSADGRFLAWQDIDLKVITILDLVRTNVSPQIKGGNFAFMPTGHRLLVISPTEKLQLWDPDLLTELPGPRDWTEVSGWASATFSARGDHLAAVDAAGDIHVWAVEGWIELAVIKTKARRKGVLFALDGDSLVVFGPRNDEVALWSIARRERIGTFSGHSARVHAGSISPDGRVLATASTDTTVRLWDVATQRELAKFTGGAGEMHSVAFSSDGKTIAAGSFEGVIQLWNVASGQQAGTLQGHISFVDGLAFSPDGSTLASGSMDRTLRLWKAASWEEIARATPSAR
jgi:WD40 repeat protein